MEICCCREANLPDSCRPRYPDDPNGSSYCGRGPGLRPAEPSELNIVCSEDSLAIQPEQVSPEEELVLKIREIINYPGYQQGTSKDMGANPKGPYAGGDIAVYKITPESKKRAKKRMKDGTLTPACLPQKSYTRKRGIFAGWLDQEPFFRVSTNNLKGYERAYLKIRQVEVGLKFILHNLADQVENVRCKDPDWMQTNTFFPKGTECYRDPSQGSCFTFGNSGSGVLRNIAPYRPIKYKYAFTGPLSMTKSCDSAYIFDNQISYSSGNPGIFTDAYCYLPWIAKTYGMTMPEGFSKKPSCGRSAGRRDVLGQEKCFGLDAENLDRGRCNYWREPFSSTNQKEKAYSSNYECQQDLFVNGTSSSIAKYCASFNNCGPNPGFPIEPRLCDFKNHRFMKNGLNRTWDQCMLEAQEGFAYNIYMCKVKNADPKTSKKTNLRMPTATT